MVKTDFQSVDEYIGRQPEKARPILRRLRAILRKALPGAEEVISYQIPAYKVEGRVAIFFAGWKEHYSLYPATGGVTEEFAAQLSRYDVSKGTIRFPLAEPIPTRLVERIAKLRAKETAERAKAKPGKRPAARKTADPRARKAPARRRK